MSPEAAPSPSETAPTTGHETARCSRCGHEAEPTGKGQCSQCGCFLPTNTVALVHGGRRMQLGRGTPLDEAERVAIRDAVLSDLGGEDEVSEVMRQLVQDFAGAVVLRDLVFSHLAATGPLTKAGRRRASVELYFSASARAERLAKQIGTDRKAATVTLADYLDSRSADDGKAADDEQPTNRIGDIK